MNIVWHGLGCVRINAKYGGVDSSVLIEPFDSAETGVKLPRKLEADIIVNPVPRNVAEGKFIIDSAGEFESSGTFVWGVPLGNSKQCLWKIEAEDMILVHAGALTRVPDDSELTAIENVDILFVPVGGHGVLSAAQAVELTTRLEPRMVIPIYYNVGGKQELDGPEAFLKAIGSASESMAKLKIAKKDLPVDTMKVVVLTHETTL
jgi:hypothetical protein